MSNMSYCRFQNTVGDVRDCIGAIRDGEADDLSEEEAQAMKHLFSQAHELVELEEDLEEYGSYS